jgi:tetratricopeptide (TPR) repeat protein
MSNVFRRREWHERRENTKNAVSNYAMHSWRTSVVIGLAAAIGGCGPPKARLAAPPIDVSPRLAEADALVRAGCFDCLRDALARYQAVRTVVGAPPAAVELATEGVVRAAGLLALRERELGFVDDGYLRMAKGALAARSCAAGLQPCQPFSQILEIIDLLPTRSAGTIGRVPSSDAQLERLQQFYRNRQSWESLLRDAAGQDSLTAYAWLSFICGTVEGRAMTLDTVLAPVGATADTPLLMFKRASCFSVQRAQLEALLTVDSRFVEVTYLLGQYATGQRKLDEADQLFQQAYAWHPQWPVLTLAIANVALTAEEFDRSLQFYVKTLELEPRAADALLGKARSLTYLDQHEAAIAVADQLLAERWLPGDAHYWRALNEAQLGRIEEAWIDIEDADKLLINDQVPKLAGIIAYRRRQLDVARTKFEISRGRNPNDCETGFYLGIVLADQRVWERSAETFVATARCIENAEQELIKDIERIRTSKDPPARQARQIARREQQIASGRRMLATSSFNTAVAYYSLSRNEEARQFAERVVDDEQFGERAREILSRLK